ncbi:hypothetical protein VP01_2378g1 [Puccinia sorghi]|uniref:Uncharacterized protein n=1 Tax=Puccinia sorghi TaxID=27349 RepID=A0A0L6V8V6_9BASI|nr:hypothetical protein VP01_2378g1 [Puccinia sorghi]
MMLLIKQSNRIMIAALEQVQLLVDQQKEKYKKFHTKSISTGFGLTDEDQKVGLSTIDENFEIMCPHYYAKNEWMGADNKIEKSSPSEPAGIEIRSNDMKSNNDYVCISTSF